MKDKRKGSKTEEISEGFPPPFLPKILGKRKELKKGFAPPSVPRFLSEIIPTPPNDNKPGNPPTSTEIPADSSDTQPVKKEKP